MMLKEITVKKGYMSRVTTKGETGGYASNENAAETTLTFQVEPDEDPEKALETANKKVREAASDLLDDDAAADKKLDEVTTQ